MSDVYRTVDNPGTGETITFVETSEESGGARVIALITLAPGGAVAPHSHRITETFECIEGAFTVHLAGREMAFPPGKSMTTGPHQLHGFRNDTDVPATLKVTATPAGDLDRVLRTLSGLSRDGLLVPGRPPRHPLVMANLACRGRYYSPPLPRWLYWILIGGMAPFGARACDRIMAKYNPAPAQPVGPDADRQRPRPGHAPQLSNGESDVFR
jgi:quercetin dioxygenase-like cupin family protein